MATRRLDYVLGFVIFIVITVPANRAMKAPGYIPHMFSRSVDGRSYLVLASNIKDGKGFSQFGREELQSEPWQRVSSELEGLVDVSLSGSSANHQGGFDGALPKDISRTPGYPVFLVSFIDSKNVIASLPLVLELQILISAVAGISVYAFLRRRGRDQAIALFSALISGLNITLVRYNLEILPDSLLVAGYTLVLIALLVFMLRQQMRYLILAALLLAVCAIIRPDFIFVSALNSVLILMLAKDSLLLSRVGLSVLFLVLSNVFTLAWAISNYVEFGMLKVSGLADYNLAWELAPAVLSASEGIDSLAARILVAEEIRERLENEEALAERSLNAAERATIYGQVGRRIALQHWPTLLQLSLKSSFAKVFNPDIDSLRMVQQQEPLRLESGFVSHIFRLEFIPAIQALYVSARRNNLTLSDFAVMLWHVTTLLLAFLAFIRLGLRGEYIVLLFLAFQILLFTFYTPNLTFSKYFLPALPVFSLAIGLSWSRKMMPLHIGN